MSTFRRSSGPITDTANFLDTGGGGLLLFNSGPMPSNAPPTPFESGIVRADPSTFGMMDTRNPAQDAAITAVRAADRGMEVLPGDVIGPTEDFGIEDSIFQILYDTIIGEQGIPEGVSPEVIAAIEGDFGSTGGVEQLREIAGQIAEAGGFDQWLEQQDIVLGDPGQIDEDTTQSPVETVFEDDGTITTIIDPTLITLPPLLGDPTIEDEEGGGGATASPETEGEPSEQAETEAEETKEVDVTEDDTVEDADSELADTIPVGGGLETETEEEEAEDEVTTVKEVEETDDENVVREQIEEAIIRETDPEVRAGLIREWERYTDREWTTEVEEEAESRYEETVEQAEDITEEDEVEDSDLPSLIDTGPEFGAEDVAEEEEIREETETPTFELPDLPDVRVELPPIQPPIQPPVETPVEPSVEPVEPVQPVEPVEPVEEPTKPTPEAETTPEETEAEEPAGTETPSDTADTGTDQAGQEGQQGTDTGGVGEGSAGDGGDSTGNGTGNGDGGLFSRKQKPEGYFSSINYQRPVLPNLILPNQPINTSPIAYRSRKDELLSNSLIASLFEDYI